MYLDNIHHVFKYLFLYLLVLYVNVSVKLPNIQNVIFVSILASFGGNFLQPWQPLYMKEIRSNMKAQEWPQDYKSIFRCSIVDESVVSIEIWPTMHLIQAFSHVLVTCKNEEDTVKNEVSRLSGQNISPIASIWDFSRR